jgi:hypothetical protein
MNQPTQRGTASIIRATTNAHKDPYIARPRARFRRRSKPPTQQWPFWLPSDYLPPSAVSHLYLDHSLCTSCRERVFLRTSTPAHLYAGGGPRNICPATMGDTGAPIRSERGGRLSRRLRELVPARNAGRMDIHGSCSAPEARGTRTALTPWPPRGIVPSGTS